ncbi:HlyD family efflux transporter periplasmic adaptor subunit [Roseomonas frigidaquae]|uniref:HlyD family efflux transporter periplasmic adaptor subunit n=1 Tax=Falsiroseomonas frigidaquae TaxID=487318 RepID=A0ABX1EVV2_9PROT|nr:HlyD family efflux transporter periplasmic adaptor subunit [Falsiroseomonas frigidaquae]NKE43249.1 HlyD family efflux transporter periplasmic adaptor subunit [Falsiroseomonas frigidaquae]
MTRTRMLAGGLLLLVLAAGAWWMLGSAAEPASAPATAATGPAGVGALGRVEPASRIRRLAPAGGVEGTRIARLLVAEGDAVRAGQVVAEFHDAALKDAALAQAEAQLAQSAARLARTRAAGRASEVAAQRARVEALRNAEASARREAERAERLQRSGAGAEATAERTRFSANQARAERAEAEAALDTLLSPRPEDLALAEAEYTAAEAAVARARAEAAMARLRAPIDGTVLRVLTRAGEAVGSDGVLEMADLTAMDVVAEVFETDLPRLRQGAPAEVVVPGEPQRFAATVREIGWQVRRTTQAGTDPVAAVDARTVEVRLTLAAEGVATLARRSNMQVQVAIRP